MAASIRQPILRPFNCITMVRRSPKTMILTWLCLATTLSLIVEVATTLGNGQSYALPMANSTINSTATNRATNEGDDYEARTTNETILDLVNFILEKNRETLKADRSHDKPMKILLQTTRPSGQTVELDDERPAQDSGDRIHWLEDSASQPLIINNSSANVDDESYLQIPTMDRLPRMSHTTTTTVISTEAAPLPIVVALQPDSNQSDMSPLDLTVSAGDELVAANQQDIDDRHIQYDIVGQSNDLELTRRDGSSLNEQRYSNYTHSGESTNNIDNQQQLHTVEPNSIGAVMGTSNLGVSEGASSESTNERLVESGVGGNQSVGRSGGVQARSMQGSLMKRTAPQQVSKPPYATYDQFSSGASNLGGSHQRAAGTPETPGAVNSKSGHVGQLEPRSNGSSDGGGGSGSSYIGHEPKVNMTPSVLNSINQIFSQLSDQDSETAGKQVRLANQMQFADSNKASQQVSSLNSLSSTNTNEISETSADNESPEVRQQLHKLAPATQPIDLSPIPASLQPLGSFQQRGHNNDRYTNDRHKSQEPQQQQAFDDQPHSGSIEAPSRYHESGRKYGMHDDLVRDLLAGQQASMMAHRQSGGSYAASLVNVTAPIVPPLSASSAMEQSLGEQTAKAMMHQASGFSRSKQTGEPVKSNSSKRHSPFAAPSSSSGQSSQQFFIPSIQQQVGSTLEPLYSQPTNQLAGSTGNSSAQTEAQQDEERQRADSFGTTGAPPTGRGPSSPQAHHYGAFGALGDRFSSQAANTGGWPSGGGGGSYLNGPSSHLVSRYSQLGGGQTAVNIALAGNNKTTRAPTSMVTTTPTTNGFITSSTTSLDIGGPPGSLSSASSTASGAGITAAPSSTVAPSGATLGSVQSNVGTAINRRVLNLTRVEHISAECSNDLIRTVIVFNGTFKGIIYSSGYVRDPNCVYINGTGKNKYEFSIRLNQCGTLGRQELHPPSGLSEVRRRDQVMWNTLSIQYNPIIEQEWDEHFRVSCEYGSDFWKTISFSPFNVETNTGSPVVFTVDPPQCQMEILRGHGMVGPRQEAASGPVTVGDPLTLLIHMKSEKAGYDILVKNCVAHNGGHQKMQLIDSNGCVVNERFISPFRGTYNDNDLKLVTLYSYLKAFRFTGSPVLYLECEIHMCQSACPPQMCYWRRLSKRSANGTAAGSLTYDGHQYDEIPVADWEGQDERNSNESRANLHHSRRKSRAIDWKTKQPAIGVASEPNTGKPLEERVSLFQALEVRQGRGHDLDNQPTNSSYTSQSAQVSEGPNLSSSLLCYRRFEVLGFLFTTGSVVLAAICLTIGCCWRAASLRRLQTAKLAKLAFSGSHLAISVNQGQLSPSTSSANSSPSSSYYHHHHHHNASHLSHTGKQQVQQTNTHHLYQVGSNLANLYAGDPARHKERPLMGHH